MSLDIFKLNLLAYEINGVPASVSSDGKTYQWKKQNGIVLSCDEQRESYLATITNSAEEELLNRTIAKAHDSEEKFDGIWNRFMKL